MNHLAFFGFTDDPFRLTPDQDFFFPSTNHTSLGEVIRYGLQQGEGFIIVIGEVGTGKTMMLRFLMSELGDEFETALLLSPHLDPKELLLSILRDLGLDKNVDSAQVNLDYSLRLLNDHLFKLSTSGKRLVVIIDEAQNLPEESIEQLRLLSNFESDKKKLLQIILVGQPELNAKIEKPNLRQLMQRVTIMETLNPLSKNEMSQYVHFRLSKAGRSDLRLSRKANSKLWKYTKGVPRLINKLMSRSLLVSFANQKHTIDHQVINEAAGSLHMDDTPLLSWFPKFAVIVSMAVMLIILIWFISHNPDWYNNVKIANLMPTDI